MWPHGKDRGDQLLSSLFPLSLLHPMFSDIEGLMGEGTGAESSFGFTSNLPSKPVLKLQVFMVCVSLRWISASVKGVGAAGMEWCYMDLWFCLFGFFFFLFIICFCTLLFPFLNALLFIMQGDCCVLWHE